MLELRQSSYDHPDAQELTRRTQEYYVDIYGGPDDDPLAAAEMAEPIGGFVLGYLDGAPVAMGGWTFTEPTGDQTLAEERVAQLRRMFVDPGLRRHGIGAAVLAHLETDAASRGATVMILATGQPQYEAVALYRRHGYTDIAPFGYYAGADLVVCLGKTLTPGAGQPTS